MKPLVELHLHLDGSLRLGTMLEIAEEEGVKLPSKTERGLFGKLRCGTVRESLADYLEAFGHTVAVMQTPVALARIGNELIEDVSKDGVKYAEVRFCPDLHLARGMDMDLVIEAVLTGLEMGGHQHGVDWGLIVCSMRHYPPERTAEILGAAVRHQAEGVVAVDMAGDDLNFPGDEHAKYFRHAREKGLNVTVHAAEAGPARLAQTAVREFKAQRIGHGVHAIDDDSVLETLALRGTGIEICLTSNVQIKTVARVEDHPFKKYLDMGLMVSLNTDNRMLADTTMTKEFDLARRTWNLTPKQERRLIENAIETSFATPAVKKKLKALLPAT